MFASIYECTYIRTCMFIFNHLMKCLGAPNIVPDVMVNNNSIRINGSNVTLTLSWGEPFSYVNPILSYTVSWDDGSTLQSFTTTDNTTRSYTIINLIPITNYIFSVVATNSIGSGEAGVQNYSTPGLLFILCCNI